jgi:hypothetical protein
MENNLTMLEEFDIERMLQTPHLLFSRMLPNANKRIAFLVLRKKENEILLINSLGFKDPAVLAGLSEKHIEYIAKNGPLEYKENLIEIFSDQRLLNSVWEIAKSMDDDASEDLKKNQGRVKKVIQYIYDNRAMFQF